MTERFTFLRCAGCAAPLLTKLAPNVYETGLYAARLGMAKLLTTVNGHDVWDRPDVCSMACFRKVKADPAWSVRNFAYAETVIGGRIWLGDVAVKELWDNRTGVYDFPPEEPSVLTFVRRVKWETEAGTGVPWEDKR